MNSTTTQRPTPETDAQCYDCEYRGHMGSVFTAEAGKSHPYGYHVSADFARKLERERDEARKDLAEERHAWEKEREEWQADYAAVSIENKAMREAIKEARYYTLAYVYNHGEGSCTFPYRTDDDLCSENRFYHVKDALDALQPFVP